MHHSLHVLDAHASYEYLNRWRRLPLFSGFEQAFLIQLVEQIYTLAKLAAWRTIYFHPILPTSFSIISRIHDSFVQFWWGNFRTLWEVSVQAITTLNACISAMAEQVRWRSWHEVYARMVAYTLAYGFSKISVMVLLRDKRGREIHRVLRPTKSRNIMLNHICLHVSWYDLIWHIHVHTDIYIFTHVYIHACTHTIHTYLNIYILTYNTYHVPFWSFLYCLTLIEVGAPPRRYIL